MPPLAATVAERGEKSSAPCGEAPEPGDFTLEKKQKNGIQRPQRIVQWSPVRNRTARVGSRGAGEDGVRKTCAQETGRATFLRCRHLRDAIREYASFLEHPCR